MWSVKCEVWGLECEGSSEKWEVWSVKCELWSLKFGVRRVQCAVWGVECGGKDTVGTGCLWTIGHLCLGNFRRRLARVYVIVGVFARPMHSTSDFAMTVLSKYVNHLKRCKTSKFRKGAQGHLDGMGQRRPIQVAAPACNFWIVMGCGQPKNHHAVFQRESHQDFWIQHMNGWRWLLICLSAQLAQSETAVKLLSTPTFCLYFGVLPGFYWFYSILQGGDERIFLWPRTKQPPVPVRCNWIVFARQMHSTTEFAMTVLSKCGMNLARNTFLGRNFDPLTWSLNSHF